MKRYCIANWKMNFLTSDVVSFIDELLKKDLQNTKTKIILSPSFLSLKTAKERLMDSCVGLAAQNVHQSPKGSFTGEISIKMLNEIECEWVILGHSERRQYFGEEDVILNDKLNTVLESGLKPVLCIGETLDQRNRGRTFETLENQLSTILNGVTDFSNDIVIAYEPVWAIGTGESASSS